MHGVSSIFISVLVPLHLFLHVLVMFVQSLMICIIAHGFVLFGPVFLLGVLTSFRSGACLFRFYICFVILFGILVF